MVAVAVCGGVASGQGGMKLVMPESPLLPPKFGAWTAVGSETGKAKASPLVEGMTEAVLKEDGLTRSSEESYVRASGSGAMKLEAFQFDDATGAVSAFTYLRAPGMRVVPQSSRVGRDAATTGRLYLFREGASVVLAEWSPAGTSTIGTAPVTDLRALAVTLPKVGGPKGAAPLLPTLLPVQGLIQESVHYAVGAAGYTAMGGMLPAEILGFDKSTEAATAEYAVRGGRGVLTLLLFPTPEMAGTRGRAVEAALNAGGRRLETTRLKREGPLVLLAAGGFTPAEAKDLIDGIHLRTEVTWNKPVPPEFHVEVRKTASLLMSIAIFSGVTGLAAVLLGLFLGFGRAWVRVLMGKPAASEPEFLRLGLSSRRNEDGVGREAAGV